MFSKVVVGAAGTLALAGAWVMHEGAIRVSVDEHKPGRAESHVRLLVPAALVPAGLRFVPDDKLREAVERARPWLPALQAAAEELSRLPDYDLVEVRDGLQQVSIVKRGGRLIIHVEEPDEKVHVSFPLRTLHHVARHLEAVAPRS